MRGTRVAATVVVFLASAAVWSSPAVGQPPREAAVTGVTQVGVGREHTCVRLSNRQLRCAGDNDLYQLGDGTFTRRNRGVPVKNRAGTAALTGVRQVAAGLQNTCAVLTNGQVRCWGWGGSGANGQGTDDDAIRPVTVVGLSGTGALTGVTQVTAGSSFECARLSSGQVRCWGKGAEGVLGNNDDAPRNRPVIVTNVAGTAPLTGVAQVAANDTWACARLANGQVRCWGKNFDGLGDGESTTSLRPIVVRNPTDTGPLTKVVQVAVGQESACAVLQSRQVRCWGHNGTGELGNGGTASSPLPVVVRAPAGAGPLTNVRQVVVGGQEDRSGGSAPFGGHACARLTNRQVRCWGANAYGQLGTGVSGTDSLRPVTVQNPTASGPLTNVTQLSAYWQHTCARLTSGQVRCWGSDQVGQLGNGPAGSRSRPVAFTV